MFSRGFGPHQVILQLLPELHSAVYGPGRRDPCYSTRNNSEDAFIATEVSLKEQMDSLMVKNQGYQKTVSVDQQSLSLMHAKGHQDKLLKIADLVKRFEQSLQIFQTELKSISLDIDEVCVKPTLVGNGEKVPDWVLVEDHDESDFEEDANYAPDLYPESSSND